MENAVSLTLVPALAMPVVLYGWSSDVFYIQLLVWLVACSVTVDGIKRLFGNEGVYGRPAGAVACDILCAGGPVGGAPGFPSGHMATSAALVTALWVHTQSPLVLGVGIPWIGAMAWSRWAKHCHNWAQIVAGTVFGCVFGVVIH